MSLFRNKLSNTMSGHLISKKFNSLAKIISFYRKVDTNVRVQSAKRKTQEARRPLTIVVYTTQQTTLAATNTLAAKTTTTITIDPNSFSCRRQLPYASLLKLLDKDCIEAIEKRLYFYYRKAGHIATNCPLAVQISKVMESKSSLDLENQRPLLKTRLEALGNTRLEYKEG